MRVGSSFEDVGGIGRAEGRTEAGAGGTLPSEREDGAADGARRGISIVRSSSEKLGSAGRADGRAEGREGAAGGTCEATPVTDDIGNRGRSLEVVVFWPSRERLLKGSTGFLRRQVRSSLLHDAGQRKVVARCREMGSISRRIARCDISLYLR